ncbi:MAG: LysM peptidoglycan-binding domain-containing protein [Vicinamibacterales bacterium]
MDRLEELKQKYDRALKKITETGSHLQNLHVQDNKLFVRGAAPSEQAKAEVWTAIKAVDPSNADLTLDLTVDSSLAPAAREQTYSVQPGDTLSKISKQFYGDANKYNKIFEANRDTLSDPDKIKPGQTLKIPAA